MPRDLTPRLKIVRYEIAQHLDQIKKLFKGVRKITIVIRDPEDPKSAMILSDDEWKDVVMAYEATEADPERFFAEASKK